jgi:hypothetical protein
MFIELGGGVFKASTSNPKQCLNPTIPFRAIRIFTTGISDLHKLYRRAKD